MSHVAIEEKVCQVCGITHSHDCGILLHKQLRDIPEDSRVTGYGLCEEHGKLFADGFVCLIAIEPQPEGITHLKTEDAQRTGEMVHVKKHILKHILNVDIGDNPVAYVEQAVINIIKGFVADSLKEKTND